MTIRVTGADRVQIDERTDVRQVVDTDLPEDCLDELTQQLADDVAVLKSSPLMGWGRQRTLYDADGHCYHVDLEIDLDDAHPQGCSCGAPECPQLVADEFGLAYGPTD